MCKFLYKLYMFKLGNGSIDSLYRRIVIRLLNYLFPVYFKFSKKSHQFNNYDDIPKIIVSLTSFPARINYVWLTIESILRQKQKPDVIVIWLSKQDFISIESLPKSLLDQQKKGLQIRFVDDNLFPHKKYFYALQEFPEDIIIIIDDDMIYPPDLLQKIMKYHKEYPDVIIASISRKIALNGSSILPYHYWNLTKDESDCSLIYLTIGAGGVLIKKSFFSETLFDMENLKQLSLMTDDLWLKTHSLLKRTKVLPISFEFSRYPFPIRIKNNKTLMSENIGESRNDVILKELIKEYDLLSILNGKDK